jgi:hypothetical protein
VIGDSLSSHPKLCGAQIFLSCDILLLLLELSLLRLFGGLFRLLPPLI